MKFNLSEEFPTPFSNKFGIRRDPSGKEKGLFAQTQMIKFDSFINNHFRYLFNLNRFIFKLFMEDEFEDSDLV